MADIVDLSDAFMHDWMKKMKGEAPSAEVLSSVKLNDFRQILNGEILENRYFDAFFVDKDGIEIGITYHYPGDEKKSSAESGWITAPFTMKEIILGNHIRKVPSVAVGCMRLSEKSKDEMNRFIHAALEQGAYLFDHADIYGDGMSESIFGEAFADDSSIKRAEICPPTTRCQSGSVQHPCFQSCCKWHGSQYGNPRFNRSRWKSARLLPPPQYHSPGMVSVSDAGMERLLSRKRRIP